MTDRWLRVRAIFEAALERPAPERHAFVAAQSGDDADLRHEVESLLAADAGGSGFLEWIPDVAPAALAVAAGVALRAPCRFGSYEVLAAVGAGAMGEVYRARDTRLNREVALKVLPPALARDPDRLSRFRREAQMLAAINHPHIAAIYGVEDAIGLHALVLELVEGPTLAERLADGPIPIVEALAIARQVALALEAAHDRGIVHRDLKPANIKISTSGAVKVLDFGLAKPIDRKVARPDLTGSRPGLILGTASYMSPEQARGLEVDRRADVWAFGCVLYEMLTARLAFPGRTVSDTIAKILEREPDWSALPDVTPPSVRRVLSRCLAKDLHTRMRDIGDVRLDLDAAAAEARSGGGSDAQSASTIRQAGTVVLGVAAIAIALLVLQLRTSSGTALNPLANARFTLLTNWEGAEEGAEISADGKFVAFLSDSDGEFDVWLTQVGTGRFTNLTRTIPALGASGVVVRKLGFAPNATDIWFNSSDGKPLMLLPLTGGPPRPFLGEGANTPAWSPDGSRLVYVHKANQDDPVYLADRTGADAQLILQPGPLKNNNPAWSPDGEWIYFARGAEPQDEMEVDLWRLRASGGLPERLTQQHAAVNYPAALDARTVLYVARDQDWSGPWLWALDVETRKAIRIPTGAEQYTSVAASRDGTRIVATAINPSAGLWRVPIGNAPVAEPDAAPYPLPLPTGRVLAPRFAGRSVFFLAARGAGEGLWSASDGQAYEVWSNVDGALFEPAAVARDGSRIAVIVRQEGKRRLVVLSADGTGRRTLAPRIEIEGAAGQSCADWSPDGKWIVVGGRDANGPALFKIPVDGGEPTRLVEGRWGNPAWSPASDLIVYAGRSLIGQVKLLAVRADGTPIGIPAVMTRPGGYRFLPDGSGLVYLPRIQSADFWRLDFATGESRQITRLDSNGTLRTFDITPDGRFIVFDRSRQNGNIVLIERAKE